MGIISDPPSHTSPTSHQVSRSNERGIRATPNAMELCLRLQKVDESKREEAVEEALRVTHSAGIFYPIPRGGTRNTGPQSRR
jgi:hypothetical protein